MKLHEEDQLDARISADALKFLAQRIFENWRHT